MLRVYHGQLPSSNPIRQTHEVWFDGAQWRRRLLRRRARSGKIDATTYYQWTSSAHGAQASARCGNVCRCAHGCPLGRKRRRHSRRSVLAHDGQPALHTGAGNSESAVASCGTQLRLTSPSVPVVLPPDDNIRCRSPREAHETVFRVGGRGANLLLNCATDRRGQISEADALALRTFRDVLEKAMSRDLAQAPGSLPAVCFRRIRCANVLTRAEPWRSRERPLGSLDHPWSSRAP